MIFFDYSSTTPMSEKALSTYQLAASQYFGNSRSIHQFGQEAEAMLQLARETIGDALNIREQELFFTGCGTEANFLIITGLAKAQKLKGNHILSIESEHHSVKQSLHYLKEQGFDITYVPLDSNGKISIEALIDSIKEETILATFAHASSELGTIQDIEIISNILKENDILFHSDCVQSFGKIKIPIHFLDACTISAHKIYGPKGCGAAYISSSIPYQSFLPGTSHENGFRAGTVDIPAIMAFAVAVEEIMKQQPQEQERLTKLRLKVVNSLKHDSLFYFEGDAINRLPFHLALRRKGMEGQFLMLECQKKGLLIATGSACRAGLSEPPASMLAIGRTSSEAHEYVRITFGKHTTEEDIDILIKQLIHISNEFKEGYCGQIEKTPR
ncbi:cysteine desulfurase [Bacillus sp. TS-2]|nr:cysteine desulfurase [Bacillus sp. TS-2]